MSASRKTKPVVPTPMHKLKAERVELMLARLPGWQASTDRTELSREFILPSQRAAAHFAKMAMEWSVRRRGEPWFSVNQRRFQVRLSTPAVGGLTQADIDFARKLSLCVEWMEQEQKVEKAAGR